MPARISTMGTHTGEFGEAFSAGMGAAGRVPEMIRGEQREALAEEIGVEAEDAAGQAVLRVGDLQLDGLLDHLVDLDLKLGRPHLGVFLLDPVDEIDSEVEVDGLVAHDVLELFAHAGQSVLPVEGEDHHKT